MTFSFNVFGQNTTYQFQTGAFLSSSGITPFWIRSNEYGIVPIKSQTITFRGRIVKDYNSFSEKDSNSFHQTNKFKHHFTKFKFGYGLQAIINVGKANELILPEAYFKLKYKAFEIYMGRRQEIFGIVDSTLSSGSTIWSGNALPMPKIQLSTIGYAPIGKAKLIAVNMGYAHGWFDNSTPLKNSYLHQKWFYLKVGKPNWKINLLGGFNHQVQWGGKIDLPYKLSSVVNNKLPSSFSDYLYLVSGISLNYTERQKKIDPSKYTSYDLTNRVGNHIGTIDIGAEVKLKNYNLTFYKQSIYDDGTLFSLGNISDGLYGFSFQKKAIQRRTKQLYFQKVVIELFSTQNQGGALGPGQAISQIRGRDDYFNHGQFVNGWSYSQNGIGSPFILPQTQINSNLPQYFISNNPIKFFTNNNRVKSFYSAVSFGYSKYIVNVTRFSISNNLGTYRVPFDTNVKQLSIMNSTTFFHQKTNLAYKLMLGYDNGKLITKSWGIYVCVQKTLKR